MHLLKSKHTPFSRRGFLHGAGATMALPFFESWVPSTTVKAAEAASGPPLRMGIFSIGAGTVLESWKPEHVGDLSELEELPSILRPLDFARDDMLILSGLSHNGKTEGLNGHKAAWYTHLTGAEYAAHEDGKPINSESVDQRAARLVGDQSLISDIRVGPKVPFSFNEEGKPMTAETMPSTVFETMFRGRKPTIPDWANRSTVARNVDTSEVQLDVDTIARRSILDLVHRQANGLKKMMGRADQQKLDEYLDSVRGVERNIAKLEERLALEALDGVGPAPGELVREDFPDHDASKQLIDSVGNDPSFAAQYVEIMSDLMLLAFQTDTTRVVTMIPDAAGVGNFAGVVTVGRERNYHVLQHNGNNSRPDQRDPIAREGLRQIHHWQTELFAKTLAKMKSIDEGGTSLLDNSMLLYTSYMANGGHHRRDYPVAMFGRAQGTLKPGRHIAYEENTPMSNLYAEMLERMGDESGEFGENKSSEKAQYGGKLPDLV